MKRSLFWLVALVLVAVAACTSDARNDGSDPPDTTGTAAMSSGAAAAATRLVLRAPIVLDGRGGLLRNQTVVVEHGVIQSVQSFVEGESVDIDLDGMTLMPGLIDTHVHAGWFFGEDGRLATDVPATQRSVKAVENALAMLAAGFTTTQSLGGAEDAAARAELAKLPGGGPRLLSSLGSLSARTGAPFAMRTAVQEYAARGADVIKIFGSESIRTGGAPSLTEEQLEAACSEANAQGLRAVVHAHGPESARRASAAGCTTIEHGALLDRATLEFMAENGTFYDPNIHLIFQNYFDNEERYLGVGSYSADGFEQMRQAAPRALEAFRESLTVPGLKVVFGTDAVAGAHGRNLEELYFRVEEGGQAPMDAVISITSLAAESLGMADRLGSVVPGMIADLIAVPGDPTQSIRDLGNTPWVMVGGKVVQEGASSP